MIINNVIVLQFTTAYFDIRDLTITAYFDIRDLIAQFNILQTVLIDQSQQ